MDISFIILTYNSLKYIEKCIRSYSESIAQEGLKAEFLIVDNGSTDGTTELINKKIFPKFPKSCKGELVQLNKNMGTTYSRNIGLKKAKGNYIVICDSDTEFIKGSWEKAIAYLKQNRELGLLAPCISYTDGKVQPSVKLFPTLTDKLLKLGKIFFNLKTDKKDFYPDFPWNVVKAVDTAISAFWMFRRGLTNSVGYLDEKIFYAPEDVDFCMRIWQAAQKVIFYPELQIMHRTQQLNHKNPFTTLAFSHFKGLIYYFKKHKYFFSRKKLYKRFDINKY